jgi:uncharacterized protein
MLAILAFIPAAFFLPVEGMVDDTARVVLTAGGIGLVAGMVGGLAGIGGSVIMLPGLALLLGYESEARQEQHTYAAAAMIVNVLVSIPASLRHKSEGAIRVEVVKGIFPAMATAVVAGVFFSNQLEGRWLSYLLAVFVAVYAISEMAKVVFKRSENQHAHETEHAKRWRLATIGALAGFVGGLLGVGGGIIVVPLLQGFAKLPLRVAIAASATVMCFTATIGAIAKVSTLPEGTLISEVLVLATAMGMTAVVGSWFGAKLTHVLPTVWVRLVVSVVLFASAVRMSGLIGIMTDWL